MKAEIELYKYAWRKQLSAFLRAAKSELVIVCPYIKETEANFVVGELSKQIRVLTLTSLKADSILTGVLEISGIKKLVDFSESSKAVNLPQLHAKVFVADNSRAIVTSANLTTSGIDRNYEYGVAIRGTKAVSQILSDLNSYQNMGIEINELEHINRLSEVAKAEYQNSKNKIAQESSALKNAIKSLEQECLAMQVGQKSETRLFTDALRYVLRSAPATTTELEIAIQDLYPQLCEDDKDRVIKGRSFGKLWKHHLRNAQQAMKKRGEVKYDSETRMWTLID